VRSLFAKICCGFGDVVVAFLGFTIIQPSYDAPMAGPLNARLSFQSRVSDWRMRRRQEALKKDLKRWEEIFRRMQH